MSFEKSKCSFLNKTKLKEEQVSLDCIINGASKSEIQQVLWINADAQIDSAEPLTKEVVISGKANVELLCLDKENKLQTIKTNIPFLTKSLDDCICPTSKINIVTEIADCDFDFDSSKVNIVVEFSIEAINFDEIEILNGADENICIKEEEISTQRLVKDDCVDFNEEIELSFNEEVEKILSINSDVIVKNIDVGNNFIALQGDIQTKIFYCKEEENHKIYSYVLTESFKREIEAEGVNEQCKIDLFACVKNDNLSYEKVENEENSCKFVITVPINVCYIAIEEINIPCAVDIFALKNNLEIVTNSYQKSIVYEPIHLENKIEGSVTLSEDEPRIDKICGVSKGYLKTTNKYIKDGELYIEGVLVTQIVYLNDEIQDLCSIKKEIPFVINEKINQDISNDCCVFLRTFLLDVDATARRGREIFIDAKIKVCAKLFKVENGGVITDAIMGEPLMPKEEAIEIYFGKKGDDLWQIAKDLRTQLNIILEQNPDISNPLEENKNIVIYHQKIPTSTSILSKKDYDF